MCKVIVYIVYGCMFCVCVRTALGMKSRSHCPFRFGWRRVEPSREAMLSFLLALMEKAIAFPQSSEEVRSTRDRVSNILSPRRGCA